jgi:hypothetical protein
MCHWLDALDGRPGAPPETRYLPDAVVVLFKVTWGPNAATRGQLILRCDKDGSISAAINREAVIIREPKP